MIQGLKCCLFALVLMITNSAFAKFAGVPNVPYISQVSSYRNAVEKLFRSATIKIEKVDKDGSQQAATFKVNHQGKQWFVKIVREDCEDCDSIHFETEWPSKEQKKGQKRLKKIGIELAYPHKGALFNFKGKQHYIASYPLAGGKTLSFYFDKYVNTDASEYLQINHPFYKALSRYGAASAHLHFKPNDPSPSLVDSLSRTVVHFWQDRNWGNELYDQKKNKIWFIDLASYNDLIGKSVIVENALIDLFDNFDLPDSAKTYSLNDYMTIINHLDIFTHGYISELPAYDQNILRKMLQLTFVHTLRESCVFEEKSDCPEADFLQKHYRLTDEEMEWLRLRTLISSGDD